jgi:RND superfamily putative drug exporter
VSGRLKSGAQVHGGAYTANQQIARQYGGATSAPGLVTINLPAGQTVDTPVVKTELAALDAQIAEGMPALREVSYVSTGSHTLVGTGRTSTLVLVYPPHDGQDVPGTVLDQLTATAKATVVGSTVHSTGVHALASGNSSSGQSTVLAELLIGALGATLVLAWVFGSFLALLPLIMALISVLTMQLFIYGLSYVVPSLMA